MSIPISEYHWVNPGDLIEEVKNGRERQGFDTAKPLQAVTVQRKDDHITFDFDLPQRGISPGQFVAWYAEDVLVGSGVIQ